MECKNMKRTLDELRRRYQGKLYLVNLDLEDAEAQGYRCGKLKPTEMQGGDFISLERGKQLSGVGFVGHMAVQCGAVTIVDYRKWRSGDNGYLLRERRTE